MAERKLHRARVDVRPRFRCLVCQRFVHGTEQGACPQCGWEPPTATPTATPPRTSSASVIFYGLLILVAVVLGWLSGSR
jgi:hypothetical protein